MGESRGEYPDNSPQTTRRIDNVHKDALIQKEAIDKKFDEQSVNLDFRERQIRDKYKADREAIIIEADKAKTDRVARRTTIEVQTKYEKDRIDAETVEDLRDKPANEAAQAKAKAMSRKTEIDSAATKKVAPILSEAEVADAKSLQRRRDLDLAETKEITDVQQERTKARVEMRNKTLAVDRWETEQRSKVNTEAGSKAK